MGRVLTLADTYALSAENRGRAERLLQSFQEAMGIADMACAFSLTDLELDVRTDAIACVLGVQCDDSLNLIDERAILARMGRHQLRKFWQRISQQSGFAAVRGTALEREWDKVTSILRNLFQGHIEKFVPDP